MREQARPLRAALVGLALLAVAFLLWESLAGLDPGDVDPTADGASTSEDLLTGVQLRSGAPREADAPAPVATDDTPARGRVAVRVADEFERPLPGVRLQAVPPGGAPQPLPATDADGWTHVEDAPMDGTWLVRLGWFNEDTDGRGHARIRAPRTHLRLPVLPLTLRFEAADTGHQMGSIPASVAPALNPGAGVDDEPVFLWVPDRNHVDVRATLRKPPIGYVFHDRSLAGQLASDVRDLYARLPLRTEANVIVRFPDQRDWHYTATAGDRTVVRLGVAWGDVAPRIHGVPQVPGCVVRVLANSGHRRVWGKVTLGEAGDHATAVVLEPVRKLEAMRAFHSTQDEARSLPQLDEPPRVPAYLKARPGKRAGAAHQQSQRVTLEVTHPGGTPAVGARVYLLHHRGVADPQGCVDFDNVSVGTHEVRVWGAGPAWTAPVQVDHVKRQRLRVRLPAPATVHLHVVDEEGLGVPYVEVLVRQAADLPWCDVDGKSQRLDPYTGLEGRRTLHNVQPTHPIQLTARLETRSATQSLTLAPNEVRRVTLTLK